MPGPRITLTPGSEAALRWPTEPYLVDEMVDCYVQWREAAAAAANAYREWSDAPVAQTVDRGRANVGVWRS